MSITTEIQRLHTNIGSIRETTDSILATIANKGVNVPSDTKLADVPSLITRIPGSGLPVSGSVELFGKTYPTITINGLEWICENLDYQWSGLSIGHDTTSAQACYVQDDETTWGWDGRRCGLLYNNAAMKYLQETILADSEWRVCTLDDLNSLSNVIYDYWNVGYHLTKTETWGTLTGDDKVGFNGKPCGAATQADGFVQTGDSFYINVYSSGSTKYMSYRRSDEEYFFINGSYNGNWYTPIRLCRNASTNSAVIGGKAYRTVKMPDGKVWLAENLDYKFCNINKEYNPQYPYAAYPNGSESVWGWNGRRCGLLYTWFAVKILNDNRADLCPGWHVPTKNEIDALATACGGASTAGVKLKALNNSVEYDWPSGWNGTDDYGFKALPCGNIRNNAYNNINVGALFWTCSENTSNKVYRYVVNNTDANLYIDDDDKTCYQSVRLVRDT